LKNKKVVYEEYLSGMRKNKFNVQSHVSFSVQNIGIDKKQNDDFIRPKTSYGQRMINRIKSRDFIEKLPNLAK
jgi:hypothetical protein